MRINQSHFVYMYVCVCVCMCVCVCVCELETYCECAVWFVVVSKEMMNGILKIKKNGWRERKSEMIFMRLVMLLDVFLGGGVLFALGRWNRVVFLEREQQELP